jgi:single-strand DNA-binding protein
VTGFYSSVFHPRLLRESHRKTGSYRRLTPTAQCWVYPQWLRHEIALAKPPQFHIINTIILIGRLGQNAEAKTAQNNKEYVVLNIATQESWKNDKGDYETRTEWHRVYAWRNLSKFAKTLQKGQLITLEGTLRYREVEDEIEGTTFKHRIAEVHAASMKRLSKIEAADDPADGAGDE